MARPDMRPYFKAQIDHHVNGMMARTTAHKPHDVTRVNGNVTDTLITVTTRDGDTWTWRGGQYAARKINGCYAPLLPTPTDAALEA